MFLIVFILLLSSNFVALCDEDIRLYVPGHKSDTIDYGMRYESEDRIVKRFLIENNTDKTYYIGDGAPTYSTFEGPSKNETHRGFDWPDKRILAIGPNETKSIDLHFLPWDLSVDQSQFRIGLWDATLEIGLSTSSEFDEIQNEDFIEYKKRFLLIGRVSDKYFDFWEKELKFDSVFVNSPATTEKELNFRNNSENTAISLEEIDLDVITSKPANDEFILEELSLPLELQPRSSDPGNDQESVKLSYRPINRGIDSALVLFNTKIENSNTITSATITGTGVVQELSLTDASEIFYEEDNDFVIDLGDIDRDEIVEFTGTIKNTGNMNFHAVSYRLEGENLTGSVEFNESKTFVTEVDEFSSFSATVTPKARGLIESEILIESDAKERKIGSYVEAIHRFEKIIIRANSIEPVLTTDILDTLDFGVLSGTEDCLDAFTQEFVISNTGTGTLQIINAFTSDLSVFDVELDTNYVDPEEKTIAAVNFLPNGNNLFRRYDQENLFLITNMRPPNDTIKVPLKAIFASPGETQLTIEDQSFYPGNYLSLPVLVEGEKITLADRFSATLSYEPTLLRFAEVNTIGSASELAANSVFPDLIEPGLLSFIINIPQGENFSNSDTLCFLEFDTFVGTKIESNMVFIEPKFGDQDCNSLIEINTNVGVIRIDSLCNIDQLIHNTEQLSISSIYPNPASENLSFEILKLSDDTQELEVEILDYFGRDVLKRKYLIDKNKIQKIDINSLPTGIYTIRFKTNTLIKTDKFIKN